MPGSLLDEMRRRIALDGPITVGTFMAEALGHPRHGYYMTRDPFGAAGDFITAPEISQTFGELIGLWCAHLWGQMGAPARINLVELGPGRGTLMKDALRAAELVAAFRRAVSVHLVEASPALRDRQVETLAGIDAAWHDNLADVPDGPLLVIANEFFDALPVRQFQRTEAGWAERLVDLDPETGALRLVLDPRYGPGLLLVPSAKRLAGVGSVVEVSPAAQSIAREVAERVRRDDGAALIIDYGPTVSGSGETLQAVRGHRPVPVLSEPGTADLTAHVDFAALAGVARQSGARTYGPVPQGQFLCALGIAERATMLIRNATPAQAHAIETAVRRLIDPAEMGTLFKALAITDPRQDPPVGFSS